MAPPEPPPDVYFGGSSLAAGPVAAEHVDVYLTWGEPPAQVAQKIDWIRELAAGEGRALRFGIRLHVITRDAAREAWAETDKLLSYLTAPPLPSVVSAGPRHLAEAAGGVSGLMPSRRASASVSSRAAVMSLIGASHSGSRGPRSA